MRNKERWKMLTLRTPIAEMHVPGWSWRAVGAICGLGGGILAPIVGSILTAIAWFTGPEWHGFFLHRDGTVLFFLSIPLLIVGAHCLDLMEKYDEESSKSRHKPDITNEYRMEEGNRNDLVRN